MTEDKKNNQKEYQRNYHASNKKKILIFLYSMKMSENTLTFGDVKVNKKEFHASKQPIALDLVHGNKIVSGKFKHSDKGFKSFIGYKNDDNIYG